MTTTAEKWGDGIGVRIPKRIVDKLELTAGSELQVTEEQGKIILKPVEKSPRLEELLAQCSPDKRHEEIDWGRPKGNEIW